MAKQMQEFDLIDRNLWMLTSIVVVFAVALGMCVGQMEKLPAIPETPAYVIQYECPAYYCETSCYYSRMDEATNQYAEWENRLAKKLAPEILRECKMLYKDARCIKLTYSSTDDVDAVFAGQAPVTDSILCPATEATNIQVRMNNYADGND